MAVTTKRKVNPIVSAFLSAAGRKGGSANTEAQFKARSRNGPKGGRPLGSRNKKRIDSQGSS